MKKPIGRDFALGILNNMRSRGIDGPFNRGDITEELDALEISASDENVDAVMAAQEVGMQMPQSEEGAPCFV